MKWQWEMRSGQWIFALLYCVAYPWILTGCKTQARVEQNSSTSPTSKTTTPEALIPKIAPKPPKRIFAKRFVVNVYSEMDRHAKRLGYLRAGSLHRATTYEALSCKGCLGGWYQLEEGGYVCNKRDVIAFVGDKLPELRAAQPDAAQALPYQYAQTKRARTPMYKKLPSFTDIEHFEAPKVAALSIDAQKIDAQEQEVLPEASADDPTTVEKTAVALRDTQEAPSVPSASSEDSDNEAVAVGQPTAFDSSQAAASKATETTAITVQEDLAPEVIEEDLPPTLESLQGERGSILRRYLERGFMVSLDRKLKRNRRVYWRTMSNGYIPERRLLMVPGSEFKGVELSETATLPYGFILSKSTPGYRLDEKGRLRRNGFPGYHFGFHIVDQSDVRGRAYYVSDEQQLFASKRVTRIDVQEPPKDLAVDAKWIDVDLAKQTLVAYEGIRPVYATLVSTGRVRKADDPLLDHHTPDGTFNITSKHVTHTMDGDHAVDGPYSIEDVPYVMYFQLAYAIHSAFWHNRFGRTKSHGCVNMAPLDAKWLFNWAQPILPTGWHGIYPKPGTAGTRIVIHGESPKG